ncbi:uncharacterized protein KY384_007419 [Bacidia gigantensis]|uniref:uncharacterized protein n=1 Tax=Bacidia gigantensis TaxID=2732470 RepID=UPI001D045411|nr:uncharacterized protein KY384_007419 [Bacidia gigantensis]KAG8528501.1 hypothetical protein KY384_007419 [Bacidia gigantensis]
MGFQYKTVLMVGATSGIGAAMADRLVHEGAKVIAVGRRQDRLDAFIQKHGSEKASSKKFDVTDQDGMDGFVTDVTTTHPDIDCLFLNSGLSIPIDLSRPSKTDMSSFHKQITTNFTALADLSVKFLPFLMARKSETSIIFLSGYSASKAALNSFVMCLRDELKESSVKIIEIWPPVVQTELHDYAGEKGRSMGMPVDEFTDKAFKGMISGVDQVTIGAVGPQEAFTELVQKRQTAFENLSTIMRAHPLI